MSFWIHYESDGFPTNSPVKNGQYDRQVSWDRLLWAALTVGRPNRQCVFAHAQASLHEAVFRLSLVRMSLEQVGASPRALRRTAAVNSLDPTEKGAVNYFLGMAVAKLFAAELLGVPWMLHLDVFRAQLSAILASQSRPDLLGQDSSGDWISLECKARANPPDEDTKAKAKAQARRVLSVGGQTPTLTIGAVTYFRGEILHFFWRDPQPDPSVEDPIRVVLTGGIWDYYYALTAGLLRAAKRRVSDGVVWAEVGGADVNVGMDVRVWEALQAGGGGAARKVALARNGDLGRCNPDGIAVTAGESWSKPFVDAQQQDRR